MVARPYQQYWEVQVQTASPAQLVLMLYDGLLRFLKQTRRALTNQDLDQAHYNAKRSAAILEHLLATLDPDAGEMAENLRRLYEFALAELLLAELKAEPSRVEGVVGVFEVLRDAWQHLAAGVAASPQPQTQIAATASVG